MEKKEVLLKIYNYIDQANHAVPLARRGVLLDKLHFLVDLVNDYKTTDNFYKYIVQEAETLVKDIQWVISVDRSDIFYECPVCEELIDGDLDFVKHMKKRHGDVLAKGDDIPDNVLGVMLRVVINMLSKEKHGEMDKQLKGGK